MGLVSFISMMEMKHPSSRFRVYLFVGKMLTIPPPKLGVGEQLAVGSHLKCVLASSLGIYISGLANSR